MSDKNEKVCCRYCGRDTTSTVSICWRCRGLKNDHHGVDPLENITEEDDYSEESGLPWGWSLDKKDRNT